MWKSQSGMYKKQELHAFKYLQNIIRKEGEGYLLSLQFAQDHWFLSNTRVTSEINIIP